MGTYVNDRRPSVFNAISVEMQSTPMAAYTIAPTKQAQILDVIQSVFP